MVDGHSKDRTAEIARSFGDGVRVVKDNGKGKGDAVRVGAFAARYDTVVYLDADGSHDPKDIPALVEPIKKGEADLVIGSRGRGGSDELHGDVEKLLRMIGSDIILIGINLRWKQHLTDSQNGFRAIRTDSDAGPRHQGEHYDHRTGNDHESLEERLEGLGNANARIRA